MNGKYRYTKLFEEIVSKELISIASRSSMGASSPKRRKRYMLEDESRGLTLVPRDTDENGTVPVPPDSPVVSVSMKRAASGSTYADSASSASNASIPPKLKLPLEHWRDRPDEPPRGVWFARKEGRTKSRRERKGAHSTRAQAPAIRWRCLRQNTGDAHAKSLESLTRIAWELCDRCVRRDISGARFRLRSRFVERRSCFARVGESNSVEPGSQRRHVAPR